MKKNIFLRAAGLLMVLAMSVTLFTACSSSENTASDNTESTQSENSVQTETQSESTESSAKKYIACIGDSITYGAGVASRDESYPAYLQNLVGNGYEVKNYGLNGRTLLKDADLPYTEEEYYTESLELKADIYIIMLGTNDSRSAYWNAENYRTELEDFVRSYQAVSKNTKVYLMQPTKCFSEGGISNTVIQNEIYPIVAEVAEETSTGLIDLYSFTEDHVDWFPDTLHPNAEGNKAIAEEIYNVIFNSKTE